MAGFNKGNAVATQPSSVLICSSLPHALFYPHSRLQSITQSQHLLPASLRSNSGSVLTCAALCFVNVARHCSAFSSSLFFCSARGEDEFGVQFP